MHIAPSSPRHSSITSGFLATLAGVAGICVLHFIPAARAVEPQTVATLEQTFRTPPDDARVMMRWWWFGPAVVKEELEREMRAMKAGGLGGFEVQPTYPLALDDEAKGIKNLKLMSPEFLEALKFTGAKAKELGLRMDLTLGSGWPYGGPEFSRSEAVAAIRDAGAVTVSAGQTSVAMPEARGGRGSEGDTLIAALLGPVTDASAGGSPYLPLELREKSAVLPADLHGATQVHFFVQGLPGLVNVKRPAFGGEGFIVDHYSPPAIEKFIELYAEPSLKALAATPPYAIFCDSLEVNGENWTGNLLAEFQKRRGYDLRPLLPALFGDTVPRAAEIRHDWGQTCTELFNDYFNKRFGKLAKEHGTKFRIQGYGSPPAALHSYAFADLNEAEGANWRGFDESRWASSASHLLGRPVTTSETWTWLHSPVFMASPLDMKAEAHLHFLQGINQLIGHGWPYTAPGIEYPGWRFYAAGVWDEKNPWWIVMPDLARYLQRCSAMLRQGLPANDVLVFLSNDDAWADFGKQTSMNGLLEKRVTGVTRALLDAGYNLDYCDDQLLMPRWKMEGDVLAFGEMKYRAIVLPSVERIPAATLRRLEDFANAGGIVVATKTVPSIAPGYRATEADQQAVQEIGERLFKAADAKGIFVDADEGIGAALAKRLQPDMTLDPPTPDIGFVHRQSDAGDAYFVANTTNQMQSVRATFRLKGKPEIWDPMTGLAQPGALNEGGAVKLDLEPYSARFVIFSRRALPPPAAVPGAPAKVDLSTGWRVSFKSAAGDASPAASQMDKLVSWADSDATKFFSGIGVYEKTFAAPAAALKPGASVQLDFGEARPIESSGNRFRALLDPPIREAAVVYVNGKRAGSAWCPPYRVEVSGLLKAGQNQLRIEVANLAVNYMAGRPQPDLTELRKVYGNRFDPQDMNLIRPMPAGLLGPIQLVTGDSGK